MFFGSVVSFEFSCRITVKLQFHYKDSSLFQTSFLKLSIDSSLNTYEETVKDSEVYRLSVLALMELTERLNLI